MVGQPKNYWTDYSFLSEVSPLGHILLLIGPEYFIVAFLCYLLSVYILTLPQYLPKKISFLRSVVIITLFLGHAWGSSTWLGTLVFRLFSIELNDWYSEWYLKTGYFIFIAIVTTLCLHNKFELKSKSLDIAKTNPTRL